MQVTSIQLKNFRSFEGMEPISLGQINVLIGPNNAGKSSILRALHLMQKGTGGNYAADIRAGANFAEIVIGVAEYQGRLSGFRRVSRILCKRGFSSFWPSCLQTG